jgi:hypothetical protein
MHRASHPATADLAASKVRGHSKCNSPPTKRLTASGLKDPRTQPRAQKRSAKPWVTEATTHHHFRKRPEGAREQLLSLHHAAIHHENGRTTLHSLLRLNIKQEVEILLLQQVGKPAFSQNIVSPSRSATHQP